jgi:hypothetical protein
LIIAANEPEIEQAANGLRGDGVTVEAVQADLATTAGVERLAAPAQVWNWPNPKCWCALSKIG